jgi:glycosyltransferase involved in cell wall biosynthesis
MSSKRRLRVAFSTRAPFISGAERSLQLMVEYFPSVGVDPLIITPEDSAIIPWCEENGVPYQTCPLPDRDKRHPVEWFRSVTRMRGILTSERINVVHANQVWAYATIAAAARTLGLPRVCHMRDEVAPEGIRWWCRSGAEAIICISHHIEQLVKPALTRAGVVYVETLVNPVTIVDPVMIRHATKAPADATLRGEIDIVGKTVFGFAGQLIPEKGLLELIEAAAGLDRRLPWILLIAGKDPRPEEGYERRCQERVVELGLEPRVLFLGFLDRMDRFYNAVDLVVVPSIEEPLGRIPLEAASYARPTVAFATGGLPETIIEGKTGWLVPTGDVEGLRSVLAQWLQSPQPNMGNYARRWAEKVHAPTAYVTALARLYEQLVAHRTLAHRIGTLAMAILWPLA